VKCEKKINFAKKINMVALTLTFQTDETVALTYRQAKKTDKATIKARFRRIMEHFILQENARKEMYSILELLHKEAQTNGLTDEMLDELTMNNE
jgi:hypothetical protein